MVNQDVPKRRTRRWWIRWIVLAASLVVLYVMSYVLITRLVSPKVTDVCTDRGGRTLFALLPLQKGYQGSPSGQSPNPLEGILYYVYFPPMWAELRLGGMVYHEWGYVGEYSRVFYIEDPIFRN